MAFCPVFTQFILFGKQPTFSCLLANMKKNCNFALDISKLHRKTIIITIYETD